MLVTPSRPGYGQTPLLPDHSPKHTAGLFIALLNELHIERAIVIGISAGGPTAIEIAATYPARVDKLILISAVTQKWMHETDVNYRRGKKLFNPSIERWSWALFRFFYFLFPRFMAKIMCRELSSAKNGTLHTDEVKELHDMIRKQRSHRGFVSDLDQDIPAETVAAVSCPTLIMHSLNDAVVHIDHARFALEHIKNSVLMTYDNHWGHLLWLGRESERPIADAISFIEKSQSP